VWIFKCIELLACLAFTSVAVAQDITTASSPVEIVWVKLGSHVGADLSVPVPKTLFKPTDKIHAVVATRASVPTPGTIGVFWTYGLDQDLQAVHDESQDVLFDGYGQTDFEISKPDAWPDGIYHVEIFLDGKSVEKVDFWVR
jgi:hypothetical protein